MVKTLGFDGLEQTEFAVALLGLILRGCVGDTELSTIWDDLLVHYNAGE